MEDSSLKGEQVAKHIGDKVTGWQDGLRPFQFNGRARTLPPGGQRPFFALAASKGAVVMFKGRQLCDEGLGSERPWPRAPEGGTGISGHS